MSYSLAAAERPRRHRHRLDSNTGGHRMPGWTGRRSRPRNGLGEFALACGIAAAPMSVVALLWVPAAALAVLAIVAALVALVLVARRRATNPGAAWIALALGLIAAALAVLGAVQEAQAAERLAVSVTGAYVTGADDVAPTPRVPVPTPAQPRATQPATPAQVPTPPRVEWMQV